jgi:hypothetical protein
MDKSLRVVVSVLAAIAVVVFAAAVSQPLKGNDGSTVATDSATAAAEAAASDAAAAASGLSAKPASVTSDDSIYAHWWVGQAYTPGDCTDATKDAFAEMKQYSDAGMSAVLTWKRDGAGAPLSVQIPATDGGAGFYTYYRTKAACDAADRASYNADLRQVYGEN